MTLIQAMGTVSQFASLSEDQLDIDYKTYSNFRKGKIGGGEEHRACYSWGNLLNYRLLKYILFHKVTIFFIICDKFFEKFPSFIAADLG